MRGCPTKRNSFSNLFFYIPIGGLQNFFVIKDFSGYVFLFALAVPHREGNSIEWAPLFNAGTRNQQRFGERQSFARTGDRTRDPVSKAQYANL